MTGVLTDLRDRFFGRGRHSVTLPPMDGVMRPNTALDMAPVLAEAEAPDHLQAGAGGLWFSSGSAVCRLEAGRTETVMRYPAPVTALARAADGRLAIARADGGLDLPMPATGLPGGEARRAITGLAFDAEGGCLVAFGSARNPADAWQKDLLEGGATGSLWRVSPSGEARQIASGLAWPGPPLPLADGSVLIGESSAARLLQIGPGGRREVRMTNLPGYPAGLALRRGGYALCLKAPRNQLIEFILREPAFCADMIRSVPQDYWIAPSLHPPRSFLEPLQGGALKQLGQMKPWAPSRSSGLVVLIDGAFVPERSFHSRADGQAHGTVSCAVTDEGLAVASVGAARILLLTPGERNAP
ncbi:MAG: hypothetical protein IAE87_19575 [Rhodobacteraceae bacterium]|jgi:hypothetical protein|nr:hypothetical protein [Paracoccaceae bacterium]